MRYMRVKSLSFLLHNSTFNKTTAMSSSSSSRALSSINRNHLCITVDVPHSIKTDHVVVLEKTLLPDVLRYKILVPTLAEAKKEEEWHCRHDTTIVDIRSGLVGSMSKRAKTAQTRAVNTEYHIQHGAPARNLEHDITIREA